MYKLVRLFSVALRFLFIVFINAFLDPDSSVLLILLLGWISVFTIGFGLDRQFRSNKLGHTSLLTSENYVLRRVAIVAVPGCIIASLFAIVLLVIDSWKPTLPILFFSLLYFYIDLSLAEFSKCYLISGMQAKLSICVSIRNVFLPVIGITFAIISKIYTVNFFEYATLVLSVVGFLILYFLCRSIRFRILYVLVGYIRSIRRYFKTIMCGLPPKLNMSMLRSYLGASTNVSESLVSLKFIVVLSAIEILMDIFYWPKNYNLLMSSAKSRAINKGFVERYVLIDGILLIGLVVVLYLANNSYAAPFFNYLKISNLGYLEVIGLCIVGFCLSLESVISYVSVKMRIYGRSQLVNSIIFVVLGLCFFAKYTLNLQLVAALFAIILIWRMKIAIQ